MTIQAVENQQSNDGLMGHVSFGYDFNTLFGIELGWQKYSNLDWKITTFYTSGTKAQINMEGRTQAFDVLVKISKTLFDDLTVMVKARAAYVDTAFKLSNGVTIDQNELRPEVAAGLSKPISIHLNIALIYSHIFKKGSLHTESHTPALDAISLGLKYKV